MMFAALAALAAIAAFAAGYFLLCYDNGFSGFEHMPAPRRPFEERPDGSLRTVEFPAVDGARIEGWLFEPTEGHPAPLVIMAPGLTGTKEGHLEPTAWRFLREGLAVLLIDFRSFGGSEGEPRHWVDPFRQVDDYGAALRFARGVLAGEGRVDPERVALWGSSFSGGSALVAATRLPGIGAVVAQCPFLDTPPQLVPSRGEMLRYVPWTLLDLARARLAGALSLPLQPVYIPAFGQPGELAFATSRENPSRLDPSRTGSRFWQSLPTPLRGGWENKLLARFLAEFDDFTPMDHVASVACPIHFVAADRDDMVPREFVEAARARAVHERAELDVHDCGHFDLYLEPVAAENAARQARFLRRHLLEPGPTR